MYLNWLSFMLLVCEHCEFQAVLNLYYYTSFIPPILTYTTETSSERKLLASREGESSVEQTEVAHVLVMIKMEKIELGRPRTA